MSSRRVGLTLVQTVARIASLCYPSAFRQQHAGDFVDVATHHFDRESAMRGPLRATLAASRVIVADTLSTPAGMWRDALTDGDGSLGAFGRRVSASLRSGGNDLRLALRSAARQPKFSLLVAGTLALGIGASTAAFDALDRAILRPLPFVRSHELTLLVMEEVNQHYMTSVPIAALNEWRAKATTVQQVEVFRRMNAVRTSEAGSEVREGLGVSGGLPSMLGVRAVAGRILTPADAQPSAATVVMIGEDYWRSAFGADPAAIGSVITVGGKPSEIVGVWPAGARVDFFETPEIIRVLPSGAEYGRGSWVQVIARMQPGRTIKQVIQELIALTPTDPNRKTTLTYQVKATAPSTILLGEQFVAGVWLVFAGGLLLLGAAIGNAGHLLLERAAGRRHELGVRLALGSSRAQLFRLFATEGAVYAAAALAAGALLALGLERVINELEPRLYRDAAGAGVFGRAFVFASLVSVLAALCCSVAPLARAGRRELAQTIGQGHTRIIATRSRLTHVLIGVQAALAVLLVFGAGLMVHSLTNLLRVDPGIDTDRLAELSVSLPASRYGASDDRRRYFEQARAALQAIPGVTGVVTSGMPMLQASLTNGVPWLEGETQPIVPPDASTALTFVDADYFRILGIRVLGGRMFADGDIDVAVVNETFARARGGQVLGRQLHLPNSGSADKTVRVVAIVNDVRYSGLSNDRVRQPALYLPTPAVPVKDVDPYARFIVRTDAEPADVISAARKAFAAIDPLVPIVAPSTGHEVIAEATAQHRFVAMLLAGLATVGFVLAMSGVYGAVALNVTRQRRDVGLRMALGASAERLIRAFVGAGLRPVLAGAILGTLTAWIVAPQINALLFRVAPNDPASAALGIGLVLVISALAAFVPARSISRIDPARTLRES